MSISQHEAVSLLNHTIFRPGWRVSAAPAPGSGDQVQVGIEIETVDSSFVTRGGEYKVPLTERALILVSASDYSAPEGLLFRVLGFIRELEAHEDREFLRTWNGAEKRWEAPFHSHAPESDEKWKRLRALPQAPVVRVSVNADGPWLAEDAGCEYVCWAEDDNKKRAAHGIIDQDCWENGRRALVEAAASPCNEQTDDDQDEGPQRVLADADCTLVNAGCASDGEVNCSASIDTPRPRRTGHPRALAHAMAHSAASDPCMEDHGGCAEWG